MTPGMCRVLVSRSHVCSASLHEGGEPLKGVLRGSSQAQKEQAGATGVRERLGESHCGSQRALRELPEALASQGSCSPYLLVEPRAYSPGSSCSFQTGATDISSSRRPNGIEARGQAPQPPPALPDFAPGDRHGGSKRDPTPQSPAAAKFPLRDP